MLGKEASFQAFGVSFCHGAGVMDLLVVFQKIRHGSRVSGVLGFCKGERVTLDVP